MITVWGGQTSRSLRVVWVMEEMSLAYRVRQVDMLADEKDAAWLAVNPGDFLPAIQQAYLARTTGRDAYKRAMDRSHEGVGQGLGAPQSPRP